MGAGGGVGGRCGGGGFVMTIGGEFICGPEGLFNVPFEFEGTTGTGLVLSDGGAKGETMIIGAVVAEGGCGVVVVLMGILGAGGEENCSNEELVREVMLLIEVMFFSSQPKPGKDMFLGITTTEEFVTCDVGIVLFADSTLILVAFSGTEISGAVALIRDVAFILEDELFSAEAFVAVRVELLREVEFSAGIVSDERGFEGEGRNRTVSLSGGVAMMYDAFSYSEFSADNDVGEGLATEFEA